MKNSHHPRKRFGQHFLHDQRVINRIIKAIAPVASDHLVEIGPGLGALTEMILSVTGQLDVIEIDRDLVPKLTAKYGHLGELRVYAADALEFDFTQLCENDIPLRIFGNLPYNISTPLIFHLIDNIAVIKDMHFMLQKEVVERMAAKPASEHYGRLSVMVQYHCQVEVLFLVSASSFSPPPQVESAVVRLIPHPVLPYIAEDLTILREVVRCAFGQRRKMLSNSLKELISATDLSALGIDPKVRAEQLSVSDFIKISNYINKAL